jgi:hydroxymethylbilane synthase
VVECREDDGRMRELLAAVDDSDTAHAIACERAFLATLDGSCRTPIAGHARIEGGGLKFDGIILAADGREFYEASQSGSLEDAVEIGRAAGHEIRRRAPAAFLERLGIA